MLPLLLYVQRFARVLHEMRENQPLLGMVTLLQYFVREYEDEKAYPQKGAWLCAVAQALEMRTAVVVIDGIDEASGRKDQVSQFVRQLVGLGLRVLCTSRPEGIVMSQFADEDFTVLDLKRLGEKQQKAMVELQLHNAPVGKTFTRHLLAFAEIRRSHDELYTRAAFPLGRERRAVESFTAPDLFFLEDGVTRDPAMRQRALDTGPERFLRVHARGPPKSKTLTELDKLIQPLLPTLDRLLDAASAAGKCLAAPELTDGLSAAHAISDPSSAALGGGGERLAAKLGLLVQKRRQLLLRGVVSDPTERRLVEAVRSAAPATSAAALWPLIVARTDEMYGALEGLQRVFVRAMQALALKVGLSPEKELIFPEELKDPVRIHEKALDDYLFDFDDFDESVVIPEACVIDVLRCRAVCRSSATLIRLQHALQKGFTTVVQGSQTKLSLVRCKNKFASAHLNPTHFRSIINSLLLEHSDNQKKVGFAEIQLHHASILELDGRSNAHARYSFFRRQLASASTTKLDERLEKTVYFLDECAGVPVLLSMLVLVFKNRIEADTTAVPSDMYELYEKAMRHALGDEVNPLALDVLRQIGFANQLAGRRCFNSDEVKHALSTLQPSASQPLNPSRAAELWGELLQLPGGVPLIKVLEEPSMRSAGQYQFRHLSFQEALAVQKIVSDRNAAAEVWASDTAATNFLCDSFHKNLCHIGRGRLGTAFSHQCHTWRLDQMTPTACEALGSLLHTSSGPHRLRLSGVDLREADFVVRIGKPLSEYGASWLTSLDLAATRLGNAGTSIAKIVRACKSLTFLDVSFNCMGQASAAPLANGLHYNHSLTSCNLRGNGFYSKGWSVILKGLTGNPACGVANWDLSSEYLNDDIALPLAMYVYASPSLTSLDLSGNNLESNTVRWISKVMGCRQKKGRPLPIINLGHPPAPANPTPSSPQQGAQQRATGKRATFEADE